MLALLTERAVVEEILEHLGLRATGPPKGPAPGVAAQRPHPRHAGDSAPELLVRPSDQALEARLSHHFEHRLRLDAWTTVCPSSPSNTVMFEGKRKPTPSSVPTPRCRSFGLHPPPTPHPPTSPPN